jgi:hypothetical protein
MFGNRQKNPQQSTERPKKIITFYFSVAAILVLFGFLATFGFLSIKGSISVSSSPNGASVYLDDVYQGEAPKVLSKIEHGSHNITLKLSGHDDWSQIINVDAGLTASISATLVPILPPKIKINYSSDMAQINENITGTAENIPDGYELWILVYPHEANKYYPQSQQANIQNGNWSIPVYIGVKDNVGDKFDIVAVLADKEARAEFTSYMIKCERIDNWPGMDKIPAGAKEYDRIIVVRRLPPNPEINITHPSDSSIVHMQDNVTGTVRNIPEGQKLWILVYPHNTNKYYLQGEAYIQNEKWERLVQLGTDKDIGTKYDIIAVLADKKAQDVFNSYLKNGASRKWPGIDEIPVGTKTYDNIMVTRL